MVGTEGRQYATRCHECRRRKVKCDGGKPACQRCVDHGLECTGYSREHEFVHFDGEAKMKTENEGESSKSRSTTPLGSRGAPRPRAIAPRIDQSSVVSPYDMEFVRVLRERCIPVVGSNERAVCSLWISKACELYSNPDSPDLIRDAVSALSLAVSGTDIGQTRTWANGLQRYSLALNQLRVGLESKPISPERMDAFLVTCLCCALYEMLVNRTIMSSLDHMNGLGALLEGVGAESIISETSRLTFYFFRILMFPILLTTRLPTFLSSPSWVSPSWKSTSFHSSTHLQALLDHALSIPSLMSRFDSLQQSIQQTGTCKPQDLINLLRQTFDLGKTIDTWHENLHEGDNTSRLYIVRLSKSTTPQEAAFAAVFPISYTYPNFELGIALISYQATRISLDTLLIDISTLIQQTTPAFQTPDIQMLVRNALECADKICQSTEYFFEEDKKMAGRMGVLPAFWVAKGLFERVWEMGMGMGSQERVDRMKGRMDFCEGFAEVITRAGLPVWGA